MQASFAAPDGALDRAACWQDAAWRALNLSLSTMIGAVLNGSDGMAIGFAFGLCLILAPDGAQFLADLRPRASLWALRLQAAIWRALPGGLRTRIEERRRT
jgi:hypothetical protein